MAKTTTNELLDSTSEDALIEQASASPTYDQFVPDPQVARELGITMMGLWRYSNDPDQNFPPNIQIRNRTHKSNLQIAPAARTLETGDVAACVGGARRSPKKSLQGCAAERTKKKRRQHVA